jgi:GTP-binding protein
MPTGGHNRLQEIDVNACKEKKLTNIRAADKDDAVLPRPIQPFTLGQASALSVKMR